MPLSAALRACAVAAFTVAVLAPRAACCPGTEGALGPGAQRALLQEEPYMGVKGNYSEVLNLSWMFYEAQRSGWLLSSCTRIPWRVSSHLKDRVPGGWYDAGDSLKLNYPMAMSVSYLAWSVLEFPEAYIKSGSIGAAIDNLKWAADYLQACHLSAYEYIGQIGVVAQDHSYWSRTEDDISYRRAYTWGQNDSCSDLLGVVSAALTATSMVFKSEAIPAMYRYPDYSSKLLSTATKLYTWARAVKGSGKYSDKYPGALVYESITGWKDKLMYAAAWLYKATGNVVYLNQAKYYWDISPATPSIYVNYDCAYAPAVNLLRRMSAGGVAVPNIDKYNTWFNTVFLPTWKNANTNYLRDPSKAPWGISKTPKGLVIVVWNVQSDPWASLRTSLNIAFQMVLHAQYETSPILRQQSLEWAMGQVNYALGSAGRSFIVGWGTNPPTHAHHRAASCPAVPEACTWDNFNSPDPNPNVLYGAMVGGPGINDTYQDVRWDYKRNEVSVDCNAGLTGALAGLLELL